MNVLLLCAGLGTRLRPLTERIPKALVPVADQTLLARALDGVSALRGARIYANGHHLAEQIERFAESDGRIVRVMGETKILGTAGPLARMAREVGADDLLVVNGDLWHTIDVVDFVMRAQASDADIALLGRDDPRVNTLSRADGRLAGIRGRFGEFSGRGALTFTGISWYRASALSRIPSGLFDIREFWRDEVAAGRAPALLDAAPGCQWIDIGTPAGLIEAMEARLAELGVASWSAVPCDGTELLCSAVCGGAAVRSPQSSMSLPTVSPPRKQSKRLTMNVAFSGGWNGSSIP